jgi:hypothetical protein
MSSLGWLIHGKDVIDSDENLLVVMPEGGTWCVLNFELQDMAARGWVDLSKDEHVTVTEKGIYWYDKYRKEQLSQVRRERTDLPRGVSDLTVRRYELRLRAGPNGNPMIASGGIQK